MEGSNLVDLNLEKEKAVNCLSEKRYDLWSCQLDMCNKRLKFQLFGTAAMIKEVCVGQHSGTVVLVTCPLTSD